MRTRQLNSFYNLRFILILAFSCILNTQAVARLIAGRVIDSSTREALEYASLGVLNTRIGTISDGLGNFSLELSNLPETAVLRISMIAYKPQTYIIGELTGETLIIELVRTPIPLEEVVVKPYKEAGTVGTTSYTRIGNWCGWGGSNFGKGHEIGTLIDLGSKPALLNSLHVHVHRQAFDTSFYRLHIRAVEDRMPAEELLRDNVILTICAESGWVEMDVKDYHIVLEGEVALSLEWLKVKGKNEDRAMKINKKVATEYVLFNTEKKHGSTYTRWGVEAEWNSHSEGSPSMFLSILR